MKRLLLLSALLFVTPAMSQDVTLTVNQIELGLIGKGLNEIPFKEAAPLLNKLQQQVMEQNKAKEAEAKKAEKPGDNAKPK